MRSALQRASLTKHPSSRRTCSMLIQASSHCRCSEHVPAASSKDTHRSNQDDLFAFAKLLFHLPPAPPVCAPRVRGEWRQVHAILVHRVRLPARHRDFTAPLLEAWSTRLRELRMTAHVHSCSMLRALMMTRCLLLVLSAPPTPHVCPCFCRRCGCQLGWRCRYCCCARREQEQALPQGQAVG